VDVVLLAAGRGHRFGGAKQFTPVAPDGSTLMEVTLRECARAGCTRAIIVTAPEHAGAVAELVARSTIPGIEYVVARQDPEDLPLPTPGREKPWGTAHALWSARHQVTGPFLVFNADDYYGGGAPDALIAELKATRSDRHCAMLGYPLLETLSRSGTVSRAICECDRSRLLERLTEYRDIDSGGRAGAVTLPPDSLVSMNAWALTPLVFDLLRTALADFVRHADLSSDECFLPSVIEQGVRSEAIEVRVLDAPGHWIGMTWPEDRDAVRAHLAGIDRARAAARAFVIDAHAPVDRHGSGLVHETWRIGDEALLQQMNQGVFADPRAVACNAEAAARRIDHSLRKAGDTDPRHRVRYLRTGEGAACFTDDGHRVWRAMEMIANARPARNESIEEVRGAALAFGRLPGLLATGDDPEPVAVLPGFHDTARRRDAFLHSAAADPHARGSTCADETDRLTSLSSLADRMQGLPSRFVHNDTKLDNVLVDRTTGEVLCVIDLDTVMPGLAAHDFGDLVRSAVTGRPEDEPDASRIEVRMEAFEALVSGYLEGAGSWISEGERESLVDGAIVIAFEQSLRFVTDYLEGDVYFRVDDPEHNLRRTRAQLRLLECLLDHEEELRAVVRSCA
jgi:NDP-sugar pyrophosphorylase family protein